LRHFHRRIYLVWFIVQFFLIFVVCCRDTLALLAKGYTIIPAPLNSWWDKAQTLMATLSGGHLRIGNPVRQALSAYTQAAGIGFGYGFFAPNVPDSYKLVFELHYADGRVEYELPRVSTSAAGLPVATLIDSIGHIEYSPLRELTVKMLAYAVWRDHPDAEMIRAVLGFVILPSPEDFKRGVSESYQFLYAYDFRFDSANQSNSP